MKLKQLIKEIPGVVVKGSKEIEISGITANSKTVSPGNLFIAKRGHAFDGTQYIPEACLNGAVAVLSDIYDPSLRDTVQLIYKDTAQAEALLANTYFHNPSQELFMVGVTGTSGKTTSTYAIKHILDQLEEHVGLIGTIEYVVGNNRYAAARTTPDVISNYRMLREMARAGCSSCVMEVTSHALDQNRVSHIEYDVAVFMNLTHEHLDYHKSLDQYFQAKQKLFQSLKTKKGSKKEAVAKVALINIDSSPWAEQLISSCRSTILTFGIDNDADIKATDIQFSSQGTHFTVHYKGKSAPFFWPLIGRFNVYNGLAAIGVALIKNLHLDEIAQLMRTFQSAPGRLEHVENSLGLNIYVDYAHKEDALKNVLKTLRECTTGKIITLFGCGGDRDREKRPKMGRVAEELSDVVIITSDNPRSEDPLMIAEEIKKGFLLPEKHIIELDRKKAIHKAIDVATRADIVLIAGKGHETKQYFSHHTIDFDDRLVAKEYCEFLSNKQ